MRNTTGRIISGDEVVAFINCSPYRVYDLPNALRRYADEIEDALITEGFEMDPPCTRVRKNK